MIDRAESLWYRDAIIYQTHVKAFFDANDDGIGEFEGLIRKLDYIQDLGANTVWLLPFYPSPLKDDGYDIQDYRGINPVYGTLRDVKRFVHEAHERGIRLIFELVINHTSDQHPWFQRARRAPAGSRYRNYYVWSDTDQSYSGTRIIFVDTEKSNWTWDSVANGYFWHRFYSHQPDLNFDSPAVIREIKRLIHYWLQMGIDGLRLDAIPYLIEREGTNCENLPETHQIIKQLRAEVDAHYSDRMLLAEANQWPEDTRPYFGDGDECHMAFHFPLMPRMFMAIAQEDRHPITDIMRQTPDAPSSCQWAIFLRNHDELTLEMVTERERDYLWSHYAADARARINVGIRRRLAPLMENDRRKIELMNSLLFSMPGTPIIYYGDEIGMGDNVFLGDRNGVRTPMQWTPDRNGGFSRANPQELYLPAIMDPVYGFQSVNVEAQTKSSSSLLNWMKRIIAVRRSHKAFSRGTLTFLYPVNRKILAYLREYEGETVLCVVNLSRNSQPVALNLTGYKGRAPLELLGRSPFPSIGDAPYVLTLPGHGFSWFLLAEEGVLPSLIEPITEPLPEFATLVVIRSWQTIFTEATRGELERSSLPAFIRNQRWFAAKDAAITAVRLKQHAALVGASGEVVLAELDVELDTRQTQTYLLPLGVTWGEEHLSRGGPLLPYTLARVRKGAKLGVLHDATASRDFPLLLLKGMKNGETVTLPDGALKFTGTAQIKSLELPDDVEVTRLGVDQSNTSVQIGRDVIVKVYRRPAPGIQPEIEVSRFLTETVGFANTPPLMGTLEWVDADGTSMAVATAFGFVAHQGDAWRFTVEYLQRELEAAALMTGPGGDQAQRVDFGLYLKHARMLGVRTAEFHKALALGATDPAFRPEETTPADLRSWGRAATKEVDAAARALQRRQSNLDDELKPLVATLRRSQAEILRRIAAYIAQPLTSAKTRIHGDYHLGQVLVAKDDFMIIDFEGEPTRTLIERRAKHSPLKDVAGMLRSFDYAAWTAANQLGIRDDVRRDTIHQLSRQWYTSTVRTFLDAYAETIKGCVSFPATVADANRLLRLFLIEKGCYELRYESAHRPAWLHVPLRGVAALVGEGQAELEFSHDTVAAT